MRRPDGREMAPEAADAIRRKAARDAAERLTDGTRQLTREELDGMVPEEIVKAKQEGRLDALLAV
ncbi:hypothetical protein [Streptomyces sp. HUAS TT20]|uniref:hypothetical protein n=1 Tax=Streptomyces sp. HUAS TT20 TaxID=3447509 RepID=UPI0021DABDEB|nr:hypothetical protein [Streptomyces sp. HUAS 15-9]UXY27502.1 hypothetical protein N8I87_13510 [Streptomyces sp. HUAS 15-9]